LNTYYIVLKKSEIGVKEMRKTISVVFVIYFVSLLFLLVGCRSKESYKKEIEQKGMTYSSESFLKEVKEGNKKTVELFMRAGIDTNAKGVDGRTALIIASNFGQIDIVKLLIKKGADVNGRDNEGRTALMAASGSGQIEMVKLLLEESADVNVRDNKGWTALMVASDLKKFEIAELLIKAERKNK